MDYLNLDVALAQLLAYFVSEKGYTIVSVQQDRDDLWLIQPKNRSFPILRLCRESREELQSKQSYLRQVNRVICDLIHRESKVIVVNVDQRAESFEDEEIRQVALLRNDDLSFARAFPDARGQLHEVSDARAELARLSRRMEETHRRPHVWRTLAALFPRKTLALFVLVIALSLAFQHTGVSAGFSRDAILDAHALWRLFSCSFSLETPWALVQLPALFMVSLSAENLLPRGFAASLLSGAYAGGICLLLGGAESAAAMPTALIAAFLGAVLCELCLTHFWRFPLMRTHAARLCLWGIIAMMVPGAELAAFAGGAGAGALCSWICHLRERRDPRFVHTLAASLLLAAGMFVIAWF